MGSSGGLYFPIRLRCADASGVLSNPDVGDAIARALGRSFARAKTALPAEVALGEGVWLHAPTLGDTTLSPDENARVLEIVNRAIEEAARAASLPRFAPVKRPVMADAPVADQDGADAAGESVGETSELFDPDRYSPETGEYEIPSYRGGKKKVPLHFQQDPFEKLLEAYDVAISATDSLIALAEKLSGPNETRIKAVGGVRSVRADLFFQRDHLETVADIYLGKLDAHTLSDAQKQSLQETLVNFFNRQGPDAGKIRKRKEQLQVGLVLYAIIRAQVAELDARVAKLTKREERYLREITMDVGSYYLEAAAMFQELAQIRITFLQNFYPDPDDLRVYAALRLANEQLPMLWTNLQRNTDLVLVDISQTNMEAQLAPAGTILGAQVTAVNRAVALYEILNDEKGSARYADLPRESGAVRGTLSRETARKLSANILQLQVEVPVLSLWREVESLRNALARELLLGDSIIGSSDRDGWTKDLDDLRTAFLTEVGRTKHDTFDADFDKAAGTVQRLHREIYTAIRHLEIRRLIIEQVPFIFVGGAFASGIAAWVKEITDGSRLLVILAEGASLTVFNAVLGPPGTRPTTVLGWGAQLGTNIVLAGVGQFFQELGRVASTAEGLDGVRRIILTTSLRAGAIGTTTALQTAIQSIESKSKAAGGESSFSELFTLNLAINGLGSLVGAALHVEPSPDRSKTWAKLSPKELVEAAAAKGVKIGLDDAANWLDLSNRSQEFAERYKRLDKYASGPKLSEAEFEKIKSESIDLAKELEQKLPKLAAVFGSGQSESQIRGSLSKLRFRMEQLNYKSQVVRLPEFTYGLKRIGSGSTWTFDPQDHRAVSAVATLKKSLTDRQITIRDLPGDGWEAVDGQDNVLLQALPSAPSLRPRLPISLEASATGKQAALGLSRVRSQMAAPELPALLAKAAGESGVDTVNRLLQVVGRGDIPLSDTEFLGMSNFLKRGGNARTLARVIRMAGDKDASYAGSLLEQMSSWDDTAVWGLETIYEVRPRTTSSEIGVLLGDFSAEDVKSVLSDINKLKPVARPEGLRRLIGQLMTEFRPPQRYNPNQVFASPQQKGARGTLDTAIELMKRFPGKTIGFEEPSLTSQGVLRIEDIVIFDPDTGHRVLGLEVKEVTSAFLGRRAPGQLAADIVNDQTARQAALQYGVVEEPYETFRWRVRRFEIQEQAVKELKSQGVSDPSPSRVEAQMRSMVRESLKAAFDDPQVKRLPADTISEYRKIFDANLSFVEFF